MSEEIAAGGGEWSIVGERIRAARSTAGLSVRELARRAGVSPSHVSQVERGLRSFSAAVLYTVANQLNLSLDSLFDSPPSEVSEKASSSARSGRTDEFEGGIVLRSGARRTIKLESGPRWERLTPQPERGSEFLEVVYPPGAEGPSDSGLTRHEGREFGVVISGALQVEVGFEVTVLEAGDSIAFGSMTPHRFRNASDEETRAIWFIREDHFGSSSVHPH